MIFSNWRAKLRKALSEQCFQHRNRRTGVRRIRNLQGRGFVFGLARRAVIARIDGQRAATLARSGAFSGGLAG
jgi:hypothetical protein